MVFDLSNADAPAQSAHTWPSVSLARVFHIGSLEVAQKGKTHNRISQEGNGLSVSLNPAAWRRIARLGGQPTWSLVAENAERALFLDVLALTPAHWSAVMCWAVRTGLVEPSTVLEVSWIDGETDERVQMQFDASDPKSARRAQEEFENCSEDENSEPLLQALEGFRATPALVARIGFSFDVCQIKDMVATIYAEDALHAEIGVQGCWWNEALDVYGLSAPRGVIHLGALANWSCAVVDGDIDTSSEDDNEDDNEDENEDEAGTFQNRAPRG